MIHLAVDYAPPHYPQYKEDRTFFRTARSEMPCGQTPEMASGRHAVWITEYNHDRIHSRVTDAAGQAQAPVFRLRWKPSAARPLPAGINVDDVFQVQRPLTGPRSKVSANPVPISYKTSTFQICYNISHAKHSTPRQCPLRSGEETRDNATPFSQQRVVLTKQVYIELRWKANYWQAQHARSVEREAALTAKVASTEAMIRDLTQRLYGTKSEKSAGPDRDEYDHAVEPSPTGAIAWQQGAWPPSAPPCRL